MLTREDNNETELDSLRNELMTWLVSADDKNKPWSRTNNRIDNENQRKYETKLLKVLIVIETLIVIDLHELEMVDHDLKSENRMMSLRSGRNMIDQRNVVWVVLIETSQAQETSLYQSLKVHLRGKTRDHDHEMMLTNPQIMSLIHSQNKTLQTSKRSHSLLRKRYVTSEWVYIDHDSQVHQSEQVLLRVVSSFQHELQSTQPHLLTAWDLLTAETLLHQYTAQMKHDTHLTGWALHDLFLK